MNKIHKLIVIGKTFDIMSCEPNKYLINFRNRFYPNLAFDDSRLFVNLIKEISKIRKIED